MGINACSDCAANNSSNSIISEDLLEQERKIEITTDTTVSNITCTEDYDNDNGDNNDDNDQSKRKDQIPGVSTSPSKITGMLVDNGLTKLGSYKIPLRLAPSTKDPPRGGLSMNLNPSAINAVVPFAEGSASGNQAKNWNKSTLVLTSINYLKLTHRDLELTHWHILRILQLLIAN